MISLHIAQKPWTPELFDDLVAAGLYNRKARVLPIMAFDYTLDPVNDWMLLEGERVVARDWSARTQIEVRPVFRMTRDRGEKPEAIPEAFDDRVWLAQDMARRARIMPGPLVGCWNEPDDLRVDNDPLDHVGLVRLLAPRLRGGQQILAPSVSNVFSAVQAAYFKQFVEGLTESVRPKVDLDIHVYAPCDLPIVGGVIPALYEKVSALIAIGLGAGYKPSQFHVSEFGAWPTGGGGDSVKTFKAIYLTLRLLGIPAVNMCAWWAPGSAIHDVFEPGNDTGGAQRRPPVLTPYGKAVAALMNG